MRFWIGIAPLLVAICSIALGGFNIASAQSGQCRGKTLHYEGFWLTIGGTPIFFDFLQVIDCDGPCPGGSVPDCQLQDFPGYTVPAGHPSGLAGTVVTRATCTCPIFISGTHFGWHYPDQVGGNGPWLCDSVRYSDPQSGNTLWKGCEGECIGSSLTCEDVGIVWTPPMPLDPPIWTGVSNSGCTCQ